MSDADTDYYVYNTLITGYKNGANLHYGIYNQNSNNTYVYNCTVDNSYFGIRQTGGTIIVKNCAVSRNTDDLSGTIATLDYCCTSGGEGTNSQTPSGSDWDNEYVDKDSGDFSLKNTGNCYDNGTDDPGSGLYSDDITGFSRTSTWDIGAFEYDDSGGGEVGNTGSPGGVKSGGKVGGKGGGKQN
jgi:hypothetical protein